MASVATNHVMDGVVAEMSTLRDAGVDPAKMLTAERSRTVPLRFPIALSKPSA